MAVRSVAVSASGLQAMPPASADALHAPRSARAALSLVSNHTRHGGRATVAGARRGELVVTQPVSVTVTLATALGDSGLLPALAVPSLPALPIPALAALQ